MAAAPVEFSVWMQCGYRPELGQIIKPRRPPCPIRRPHATARPSPGVRRRSRSQIAPDLEGRVVVREELEPAIDGTDCGRNRFWTCSRLEVALHPLAFRERPRHRRVFLDANGAWLATAARTSMSSWRTAAVAGVELDEPIGSPSALSCGTHITDGSSGRRRRAGRRFLSLPASWLSTPLLAEDVIDDRRLMLIGSVVGDVAAERPSGGRGGT